MAVKANVSEFQKRILKSYVAKVVTKYNMDGVILSQTEQSPFEPKLVEFLLETLDSSLAEIVDHPDDLTTDDPHPSTSDPLPGGGEGYEYMISFLIYNHGCEGLQVYRAQIIKFSEKAQVTVQHKLSMAFSSKTCTKFLLLITIISTSVLLVHSAGLEVGDKEGWAVPTSKNDQFYNQWASRNRFKVGDSISFKYKHDSVLVVTESEYEKCHSPKPIFFSNNGSTVFEFDHSGLFYFISGIAGHCDRSQKMIIKVLEEKAPPPDDQNEIAPSSNNLPHHNAAVPTSLASSLTIMLAVMAFLMILLV
ncbi:hypothetical protein IFM89_030732 [Coptis chinensis]|uniref:Phytocyanin domain-containing protein n=1 Tax=Coptis chinensis TaxID=261450 RepID=A0A835MGA5_9MAGN|nr:hypothetical protein IFM89_030732 [Coptis chinensis]